MKNTNGISDYTKLSKDYDATRYKLSSQKFVDLLRKNAFSKLLNPDRGMTILDVGCGTDSGVLFFLKM